MLDREELITNKFTVAREGIPLPEDRVQLQTKSRLLPSVDI